MTPVTIMMATRNGAAFLNDQLGSFIEQTHPHWSLRVSDDGSTDETPDRVRDFAAAHPDRRIDLVAGPQRGSAANFMSLLASWDVPDGYVALSDQDDVWMPHKIARALECIGQVRGAGPVVYATRTILADARMNPLRESVAHQSGPAFGNALVQNILSGNTIVVNPAAFDLLRATAPAALAGEGIAYHDWWIYQVLSGAGAHIICDTKPGLYYRQHNTNTMGVNRGATAALTRLNMIRNGQFADWIDRNTAALARISDHLTPQNRALLGEFRDWRAAAGQSGRKSLGQLGIHRQTRKGDLFLRALAMVGYI